MKGLVDKNQVHPIGKTKNRKYESLKNTYNQIDNYLKSLKNNYDIISQGIVIARGYETDFIESINSTENIGFIDLEDLGFD